MARPVPVIAAVSDIMTLPTATILLDGSGSLPSGGATTITAYAWTLVDKPPGAAATLTDATTATPTLNDVDIEGTYIVFLVVTDDAGRSSFGTPYALQHLPPEDLSTFDVPLYAFESPVAGAFVSVRAPYASVAARLNQSLYKTGRGEYGWLATGLWPLTELLSDLRGEMLDIYDAPNKELQADAISPQTPGAGVTVDGLVIKDTGSIITIDSVRPTIRSLDDVSIAAGKTLRVEATGTARFDDIASTSGGDITSTSAIYAPEVKTPLVTSVGTLTATAGTNLTVGATGTGTMDVGGTLSLESNGADVAVTGDTGVDVVATTNDITLTATAGDVVLTAGAEIELVPTTFTTTAKPLFAPGLVYGVSAPFAVLPLTSVEESFAAATVTRHVTGSSVLATTMFRYLLVGIDHEATLYWKIQSAGAAATYVLLGTIGAAKAAARLQSELEIPLVVAGLQPGYSTHTVEKVASDPATTAVEMGGFSALDILNDLTVSVVVIPDALNNWDPAECTAFGTITVRLITPTAEAVL